MLDLLALEEAQAAIHPVGQAGREQRVFKHPRLCVRAVKQRDLDQRYAGRLEVAHLFDDELRFLEVGLRLEQADRLALRL